ncbi:hypothetical protein [Pantoea sp. GD03673]|uniref:hypothetical protein n=1 Tax=Pantoea sp. GD03673 TaxID=2975364 RepID=UPI00244CDC51|nr:hypothetical protein [Pantoea sp. GD03673]MDH2065766.1 hypothetical protein [Pantoea sp. GD03673]
MMRFVDFLTSKQGLRAARNHCFELNGVVLGHFTALFLQDNQIIFTKDGKQCAVPYYLGPDEDLLQQKVNPRIKNIRAI